MGNVFLKKLKLYRVATVLSILPKYWKSSEYIAQRVHATSRWSLYVDMLCCLFRYGASDDNYLQFRFYGKPHKYRNSFITWRRNMAIMRYTPKEVVDLFLNKVEFNKRFARYMNRGWLDCRTASEQQIWDFIRKYPAVIVKPMDAACGVGICRWITDMVDGKKIKQMGG